MLVNQQGKTKTKLLHFILLTSNIYIIKAIYTCIILSGFGNILEAS